MEGINWTTLNTRHEPEITDLNLTLHNTTDLQLNTSTTVSSLVTRSSGGARYLPWDNPLNVMTKETSDDITFSLQCFVFPILTVFGITGNILSMIVMLQKKLRNSTTTIVLVGLALSDILFLGTNMIRKSTCIIREFDNLLADAVNAKTFSYAFYFKTSFSRISTLLVVVISLERLIAVAFPLFVKTIVTKTRMLIAVITCYIVVLASLAAVPPQLTYATVGGRVYIALTDFSLNNVEALTIYNDYFLPITFRFIPIVIVCILNIAIIILLKRRVNYQIRSCPKENKRNNEHRQITRLLLVVSVIYTICLLPGNILLLCTAHVVDGFSFFGTYHNLVLALSDISLLFEIINSSVNFIIYMLLNRRFNETYRRIFCPCVRKNENRKITGIALATVPTVSEDLSCRGDIDRNDIDIS